MLGGGSVPVTELRAAVIIGSGSASFEMLRNLTEVLPVMITPRWVSTRCQPVAIRDILHWLVRAIATPEAKGRVLEVGRPRGRHLRGDDAGLRGGRRPADSASCIRVPLLTPRLSSHWVGLVTPLPLGLARPLIDSLVNEVIVLERSVQDVMPHEPLTAPPSARAGGASGRGPDRAVALVRCHPARAAPRPTRLPTDPDWAGRHAARRTSRKPASQRVAGARVTRP